MKRKIVAVRIAGQRKSALDRVIAEQDKKIMTLRDIYHITYGYEYGKKQGGKT